MGKSNRRNEIVKTFEVSAEAEKESANMTESIHSDEDLDDAVNFK